MTLNVDGSPVGASSWTAGFLFLAATGCAFSFSLPFKLGAGCTFFVGTGEPFTRAAESFGGSVLAFLAALSGPFVVEICFGMTA